MTRTLNRLRGLLNVTGRRTSPTSAEVDGPELAAASA
jgi:hypothetical protein